MSLMKRATRLICGLLLAITLCAGMAQADRASRCQKRMRRQQAKIQQAVQRYGVYSKQAEQQRLKLRRMQSRCYARAHR